MTVSAFPNALPVELAPQVRELTRDGSDVMLQARLLGTIGFHLFAADGDDQDAFDNFALVWEGTDEIVLRADVHELAVQVFTYLNDGDTDRGFPAVQDEFITGYNAAAANA